MSDEEDLTCSGCGESMYIGEGCEQSDHGLCWECSSAEVSVLQAELRAWKEAALEADRLPGKLSSELPSGISTNPQQPAFNRGARAVLRVFKQRLEPFILDALRAESKSARESAREGEAPERELREPQ